MPGRRSKVTPELYAQVLAAWLKNPSPVEISRALGVSRRLVERLAREGAPELGLEPLPPPGGPAVAPSAGEDPTGSSTLQARIAATQEEADQYLRHMQERIVALEREAERAGVEADMADLTQRCDGTLAKIDAAKKRVELDAKKLALTESRAVAADTVQKSADEVVAARVMLKHCVTAGAIFGHLADRMLGMIEMGKLKMPDEVTPRAIASLTGSLERLANATEKAIKIERARLEDADSGDGQQLSYHQVVLKQCTPEELDFISETGRLPDRFRLIRGDD